MLRETLDAILSGGAAGAVMAWLVQQLIADRLRESMQYGYAIKLEDHKAEVAARIDKFRGDISELERLHRERWNLKREACLSALGVVDKVYTNIAWGDRTNPDMELQIARSRVEAAEARDTMNRLILACDDPSVVHLFLKCIGLQETGESATAIDPGDVQQLRNAIRRELGFGADVALNPNLSWILSVHGDGVVGAPGARPASA